MGNKIYLETVELGTRMLACRKNDEKQAHKIIQLLVNLGPSQRSLLDMGDPLQYGTLSVVSEGWLFVFVKRNSSYGLMERLSN